MPFRRRGRKTWYFQARTRDGAFKQRSTGTENVRLAREFEKMWEALSKEERAWDILAPVLEGTLSIGALYDVFVEAKRNLPAIRRHLNDFNHNDRAQEYLAYYASLGRRADTLAQVRSALEWLFPPYGKTSASAVSTAWLSERLSQYPASNSTRRKVRSGWNGYFDWLVNVRELIEVNPLTRVQAPALPKLPIAFFELDQVERIVESQLTEERRALFALMYGTGIEVSTALTLTRDNILPNAKEIRAPGTKAHSRDRMVRVSDWAWNLFWEFAKTRLYGPIFSVKSRHTVSGWHNVTVAELGFAHAHPLKNARHHWAATRLRAGASIQVVQRQLGHSSPTLTLNTYGAFLPTSLDHDRIEDNLRRYEIDRRSAMGGAR